MQKAIEYFNKYFSHWDIEMPADDAESRSAGAIFKRGWSIRYIFGKDAGREYLEFYAAHRMTDDRHHKVYEDGEVKDMDAICSMFAFGSRIPGDREHREKENREYNERVYKKLEEKGLDIMTVNTYLSLKDLPEK